jgi:hypothetical protein
MSNFKQILIPALAIVTFSTGCDKTRSFDFTGKAQKGPFLVGANVTVNELNSSFEQTGKSFTSSIASDDGSFGLNSVELETDYALVTVNGAFFDEVEGTVSNSPINLQAVADLSGGSTVNVNALTHVVRSRVESLVSNMSFEQANSQAQRELVSLFFGESEQLSADFDQLDISKSGDDNAALLAFSLLMMRGSIPSLAVSTATLVELLTRLRTDFGDNANVDNPALMDQVRDNASRLNELAIRRNLEARYLQIGQTVAIPNFEKYLGKFQLANADTVYQDFYYPASGTEPDWWFQPSVINLLDKSLVQVSRATLGIGFQGPCIAAVVPVGKKLTVKLKGEGVSGRLLLDGGYPPEPGPHPNGFVFELNSADELVFSSQRQNIMMTYLLDRLQVGDYQVEYYENGSSAPTHVKVMNVVP